MDRDGATEIGNRAGGRGHDEGRIDFPYRAEPPHADGDGGMLGRVLIYASIVVVVVTWVIWKRIL